MNQIAAPFFSAVSALSSLTRRVTLRPAGATGRSEVPLHVALILGICKQSQTQKLDENERFTKEQQALLEVTDAALKKGVGCLSVSLENFWHAGRTVEFLNTQGHLLGQRGVRLTIQTSLSEDTPELQAALDHLSSSAPALGTEKLRLHLLVAVNAASELSAAVQRLARKVQNGTVTAETFTREDLDREINQHDAAESVCLPEVDLLLHTADASKLSRSLLWKTAYAEIFFSSACWLDFTQQHFADALSDFAGRRRTFGGLK